jgi:cation diffusion facilitator family transporter
MFKFRKSTEHSQQEADPSHGDDQGYDSHSHSHGAIDPALLDTQRGIWATKWSLVGLLVTALFQLVIVLLSGSVALLADTIHNFGDAGTAIPLWLAFIIGRRNATRRFTYGYGRIEELAGLLIVLVILGSAILAAYESVVRIFDPPTVRYIWIVVVASLVGFLGNEAVALFRIKVGREISSAALVADGYHARTDGLTSLAVLFGAIGVWLGFPLADPIVGLLISIAILRIVWQSGKSVFTRLLDGVDPEVGDEVRQVVGETPGVEAVSEVRVRWLGHRLWADVNVAVASDLTVQRGHEIAQEVHHRLLQRLRYLSNATIHVDPVTHSGEEHHQHNVVTHSHDDASSHQHQ